MTLRIITGTITEAKDTFRKLEELKEHGAFNKWHWQGNGIGWTCQPSHILSGDDRRFSIIQTTGSGKTIIAVLYLYRAHLQQIETGANFSIKWTKNNRGKKKEDWLPVISCMEDLEQAKYMHITLDDIRSTISSWNTKDAKMVSEMANATRKRKNWIDITTQRLENFIPPDLRFITDEIIVPYIRCVDDTRRAPDGRGTPLEVLALRFSPGHELLDYHIYNLANKTGQDLLNSYDTLQVAIGLKENESRARTNQPGYELEVKALQFLKENASEIEWKHLNGKHAFDITSPEFAIDVCAADEDGNLLTNHKTWARHIGTAKRKGQLPYLMFPYQKSFGFLRIKYDLPTGSNLDISVYSNRIRLIDTVLKPVTAKN